MTWALFLLGLAFAAGCDSHPGRVLVVVDSDYPVPAELSEVRILAGPADDADDRNGQAFVLTRVDPPPLGTHHLPLSLTVTPRGGDSDRRVEVVVEGRSVASGEVLIRATRVLDGFRAGNTIVLPVFLSRSCEDVTCGEGLVCIDGGCETNVIDPGTLRIAEDPGEEFRELGDSSADADAGIDAARDSETPADAMPDAAIDAGPCGRPVTVPHVVTLGDDTLFPLSPAPGRWAYHEPMVRRFDTYVEWTHTTAPGCEIFRVEALIPEGMPADPFVACTGTCATRPTVGANYEVYLDGSADYDEIITADQSSAVWRLRLNLENPSSSVTIMLSDWTNDFVDVARNEVYVVFHDATFYSRPVP